MQVMMMEAQDDATWNPTVRLASPPGPCGVSFRCTAYVRVCVVVVVVRANQPYGPTVPAHGIIKGGIWRLPTQGSFLWFCARGGRLDSLTHGKVRIFGPWWVQVRAPAARMNEML
jgi:hypothetical protein